MTARSPTLEISGSQPRRKSTDMSFLVARSVRKAVGAACSRLYVDAEDYKPTVMIAGSARSGTTWLAESLASVGRCRLIYEPFNPEKCPEYSSFNYFTYERPDSENAALRAYCEQLFAGRIRNRWVDQKMTTVRPKRRLVKAVRANLLVPWMRRQFPHIPVVLLVRNPFAVVASRMQLGWATDSDLRPMLSQPLLIDDYLEDRLHWISSLSRPEEKHAAIWCIHNLVAFSGTGESGAIPVFYENLCCDPKGETERITKLITWPVKKNILDRLGRPSSTSISTSAIRSGTSPVSSWRDNLSTSQRENVHAVVRDFDLDSLYGDQDMPLREGEHFEPSSPC